MTITKYDKFALKPTRCSKCNRLFIFEWYNFSPCCPPLKIIKCKRCINKGTE